jgi:putative acetyltransferase
MNSAVALVRDERATDFSAISAVTVAAFTTLQISSHTEQFVIDALRTAGALTVSLVAELDGRLVGHIALSPVTMSDGTKDWYGLGPVSVHPDFQGRGIGKALVQEGLTRLRCLQASGCCLVGHPQYYRQFGFENATGLCHEGVPDDFFFVLAFAGSTPQGKVSFHEAFQAKA